MPASGAGRAVSMTAFFFIPHASRIVFSVRPLSQPPTYDSMMLRQSSGEWSSSNAC